MIDEQFEYNNEEEAEVAQIIALQRNSEAINAIRARMPKGPSLEECEECGEEIPEARRLAVPGVKMCIHCQSVYEHKSKFNGG